MCDPGFEGNDQEWQEQYHAMSEFFGWQLGDSESGITPSQFAELVDNDEDTTESELRQARHGKTAGSSTHGRWSLSEQFLCWTISTDVSVSFCGWLWVFKVTYTAYTLYSVFPGRTRKIYQQIKNIDWLKTDRRYMTVPERARACQNIRNNSYWCYWMILDRPTSWSWFSISEFFQWCFSRIFSYFLVFSRNMVWSWQVLEKLLAERRRTSRASVSSASVDPVDPVDTWKRQSFVRSQDSHSRAELSPDLGREQALGYPWMLNGIPWDTRDVGFGFEPSWTLIWTYLNDVRIFKTLKYATGINWRLLNLLSVQQHQKTVNTYPPWLIPMEIQSKEGYWIWQE